MAREITEIKKEITHSFMSNETLSKLYGFSIGSDFLEEFSKVSVENILFDSIAFAIWVLEKMFDKHKQEVDIALTELKPHTARWYRNKALSFQYGFDLIEDSDKYNNVGASDEDIEASQIIKYSSVVEAETESRLIIKIATEQGEELNPIPSEAQHAFESYINEIKDAGVRVTIINYKPDILQLKIRIVRDPLVLDAHGMSILTGRRPVQDSLQEFMKELPFNGELVLQQLANKLEQTEGVKIVQIDAAFSKWIDPTTKGYGQFTAIDIRRIPVSGYFKIENFDNISYVV